jgi:hypothetical protein
MIAIDTPELLDVGMTNPNWLDEERRGSAVYAATIHPACQCKWNSDQRPGEFWKIWVLTERNKRCVIHGANGHV